MDQGFGSRGARQRRSPTGAWAYGTPFQLHVPVDAASSLPSTGPPVVWRCIAVSPAPGAAQPARQSVSIAAHRAGQARPLRSSGPIIPP